MRDARAIFSGMQTPTARASRSTSTPNLPLRLSVLAALVLGLTSSCVTHSHAMDFNGVPGPRGYPVEFQKTTSYSLNLLFIIPLLGDSSREETVAEFTKEAKERGAKRVYLESTSSSTYWYIFPPLSFFIHPVETSVEGAVEGSRDPKS